LKISAKKNKIISMKILAIETSCDDTSVSVVENGRKVLSSVVSSQTEIHSKYGGVVPEVAARAHIKNMLPVLEEALTRAKADIKDIDYIAVSKGPGLIGSLVVGVNTARTLAFLYDKPLIALHHTEGHIYANWLDDNLKDNQTPPKFPLLCLTVSGGHTNIIYMKDHLEYQIVGQTIDDAAGEAYDKVAKMLGMTYPGGPVIAACAEAGCPDSIILPRTDLTQKPKRNEQGFLEKPLPSLDFSFSGLKTAVLKEVKMAEKDRFQHVTKEDIAAAFQLAANEILVRNLLRAIKIYFPRSILLSGGVAANIQLRRLIKNELENSFAKYNFYFPNPEYCTDNAAMIGAAAYWHIRKKSFIRPERLTADPNYRLKG
jgi:N6-L-threonylcarbamoyladenine synthase